MTTLHLKRLPATEKSRHIFWFSEENTTNIMCGTKTDDMITWWHCFTPDIYGVFPRYAKKIICSNSGRVPKCCIYFLSHSIPHFAKVRNYLSLKDEAKISKNGPNSYDSTRLRIAVWIEGQLGNKSNIYFDLVMNLILTLQFPENVLSKPWLEFNLLNYIIETTNSIILYI